MDDPRESRKEEKPSTREGMIDGIHYRETRAIRPHPEEPGSFLSLFLLPSPPPTPLRTPTLSSSSLPSPAHTRCLSQLCSTLMHLLAYRYNCRAIIKAGLSFPPPSSSPPIQPPFSPLPSSLPSLFIPPFSLILYLSFLLGPHWIANAFRSRSTCVPIAFCSRSPTPCTDFGGKSRRINFCARISTGACSWRAEYDRG